MSLLLEALKKAERAKEEAQRKGGETPKAELTLQEEAPAQGKHVVTRSELPDIRQPLDIRSDDIAPAGRRAEAAAPKPRQAPRAAAAEEPAAAERATARKVFEVKHREPNPRLPFYIALGVLGTAAIGIVVYFWYQLRPPPLLVNPNPPAGQVAAAAPGATPVPPSPASAAPTTSAATAPATQGAITGLPGLPPPRAQESAAKPSAPAPAAVAPRGAKPSAIPADPPPRVAARPSAPQAVAPAVAPAASSRPTAAPAADGQLSVARPVAQVHPRVDAAYAAFLANDLTGARASYEAALRDEPGNRDALLGLAAVDVRSDRLDAAEATYLRLLRADPRDAHAHAGLLGLHGGRVDPLAAESRLKSLLAAEPNAHVLHFALGNQLAQQGRWGEAQLHYFKAYSADPENPDFAFNLAVSLDHLRQSRLARQYYERAVALAGKRSASFASAAAQERVKQLAE